MTTKSSRDDFSRIELTILNYGESASGVIGFPHLIIGYIKWETQLRTIRPKVDVTSADFSLDKTVGFLCHLKINTD